MYDFRLDDIDQAKMIGITDRNAFFMEMANTQPNLTFANGIRISGLGLNVAVCNKLEKVLDFSQENARRRVLPLKWKNTISAQVSSTEIMVLSIPTWQAPPSTTGSASPK